MALPPMARSAESMSGTNASGVHLIDRMQMQQIVVSTQPRGNDPWRSVNGIGNVLVVLRNFRSYPICSITWRMVFISIASMRVGHCSGSAGPIVARLGLQLMWN
jgi:hypothetical protein